jgi:hypothetical protein
VVTDDTDEQTDTDTVVSTDSGGQWSVATGTRFPRRSRGLVWHVVPTPSIPRVIVVTLTVLSGSGGHPADVQHCHRPSGGCPASGRGVQLAQQSPRFCILFRTKERIAAVPRSPFAACRTARRTLAAAFTDNT